METRIELFYTLIFPWEIYQPRHVYSQHIKQRKYRSKVRLRFKLSLSKLR